MKKLREIWRTYQELDGHLDRQMVRARSPASLATWARRRTVNDQAYFVMLFACFEDRVTSLCERLVTRKQSHPSWRQRRLWDTVDPDRLDFMPFMNRVALLVEKGRAAYGRAKMLYGIRCSIAHGAFAAVGPLNLRLLYQDVLLIWRTLRA